MSQAARFSAIEQEVLGWSQGPNPGVPAMATKLLIPPLGRVYAVFAPITELLIRLMAGGALAFHGQQILFGNIEGAGRFFESVGFENRLRLARMGGVLAF